VRLGKVSIAVKTFGVCDFPWLAVTVWRLRRRRLCFLALSNAPRSKEHRTAPEIQSFSVLDHNT